MTDDQIERLRLHFANERTFLAWVRTATVLMGFGYAIARLALYLDTRAHAGHTVSATYLGGIAMTVAGLLALAIAAGRYEARSRGIDRGASSRACEGYVFVFATLVWMTGLLLLILLLTLGSP